jgi:hypothetical protein
MTVVGTLHLTRDTNRLRYTVVIDGTERGTLAAGEEKAFALPPGQHSLEVKVHWAGSPRLTFDLGPALTVHMRASRASQTPWVRGRTGYLTLTPAG